MSERFDASIKRGHQAVLSSVMGRMQAGSTVVLAPQEFADLSDLAGALNYYAAQPAMPVVVVPDYVDGEGRRVMTFYPDQIIAVPFVIAAGPWANPQGYASSAEYGAPPAMRKATLSQTAGDMTGATTGMGVTLDFNANAIPGGRWYYNCHVLPEYPPTQSGFSVAFPH